MYYAHMSIEHRLTKTPTTTDYRGATMEQQPITPAPAPVPPLMAWRKFAEWICVDEGVVKGWIESGYLPSVRIGKHRLVNITLLSKNLMEEEMI